MSHIEYLLEQKKNQIAAAQLAIKSLEIKIQELEMQVLQMKLIYFPMDSKN